MARTTSLLLALSLAAIGLPAQETPLDSMAFHAGQWGMQFRGGSNLVSVGALKFTSARSAWLLDISSGANFFSADATDKFGGTSGKIDQQVLNVNLRIGKRAYQAPRHRVVSFQTVAIETGFHDLGFDQIPSGHIRQTTWNLGLNGEVGGAYMLSPSVSVGGTATVSAGYYKERDDTPQYRLEGHGYYLNGIQFLFALGVYF